MRNILLLIPLISAVTGWVTIALALNILFRPKRRIRTLFNLSFQGLIPKKQEQLAAGIKEIISGHLRCASTQEQGLAPEVVAKLTDAVVKAARDRTERKMPLLVPKAVRQKIAGIVEDIIRREIPVLIESLADNIQKDLGRDNDFCRWIADRVMDYDILKLENIVLKSREALILKSAAAVTGFVSGLLQLVIVNYAVT